MIDQPAADVKIFGQPGVSYEHFEMSKGEYICFGIMEKLSGAVPGQSAVKCMKDDMIGSDTRIAAMGLLMNGNKEHLEICVEDSSFLWLLTLLGMV